MFLINHVRIEFEIFFPPLFPSAIFLVGDGAT